MPVDANELLLKYSTKAGAAGNSGAGTAAGSLGKYISQTQIPDATLHAIFDQVTGDENAVSESEYRCIFIHNSDGALTVTNLRVFLLSETAGGASIAIGVDPTAASAIGSVGAQAVEVANEDTAPAGVVFSSPNALGTALNMGDIPAGQCKALWIRRTAANTGAVSGDSFQLRFAYESL